MEYVKFGNNGLDVSKLCLDCMSFGVPEHLVDAVAALSIKLTPEEIAFQEELYVPHSVIGF